MQRVARFIVRLILIGAVVLLLLVICAIAQEGPPQKPVPTVNVQWQMRLSNGSTIKWYERDPVPHRTADHAFFAHVAVASALTIADFENTEYLLRHGYRELNPIFGPHPSRLRLYGIALPMQGALDALAWHWKRQDDAIEARGVHRKWYEHWYLIVDGQSITHAVGLGTSIANTGY